MDLLIAVLIGFAFILLVGFVFESIMRWRDQQRFGKLPYERIPVDSYSLHVERIGQDFPAPTVVFLSTIGGSLLDWQLVISKLGNSVPILAYDRSGYGWSSSVKGERNPQKVVDELHALLQAAEMPSPVVLAGHGFGGLFARLYQAQHPENVAGIVLVDSSHPELVIQNDHNKEVKRQRNILRFRRFGILRLMLPRVLIWIDKLTLQQRQQYRAVRQWDIPMTLREVVPVFRDGVELPDSLGDLPLTVLSRSVAEELEFSQEWADHQEDLAKLSSDSTHITLEKGDHYVQFAQPEVVATAISDMVNRIRAKES
ncbi:MAG: alpha/beta hydrolase [Anaerolineaceae bacterium]|nr:alpha/beta hydrolase [Anaerolineaceae bacterium]